MPFLRKIAANTPLCLGLLAAAFIYGLVLPFCWGNNPASAYGTLSLLCEHRVGWFWVWALLTGGSIALNLSRACATHGCRSRIPEISILISLFGMLLTAATLNHSIESWNPKRVAHWIGAIAYAAFLLIAVSSFYLACAKRHPRLWILLAFAAGAGLAVLVQLLVFGRNGYMEILPIALVEIELVVMNFTKLTVKENGAAIAAQNKKQA